MSWVRGLKYSSPACGPPWWRPGKVRCAELKAATTARAEHDGAGGVVDQAGRQAAFQLAAAGLGQQASLHAGPQEMELAFGHGPFETQEESVVEAGRVIQAVFVADQGVVVGADLDELLPVGRVAGQPGALQAEHDPGAPERHLSDQVLEPLPVGG